LLQNIEIFSSKYAWLGWSEKLSAQPFLTKRIEYISAYAANSTGFFLFRQTFFFSYKFMEFSKIKNYSTIP